MSPWLLASVVLVLSAVPAGVQVFKGDAMDRLVGLELMGIRSR